MRLLVDHVGHRRATATADACRPAPTAAPTAGAHAVARASQCGPEGELSPQQLESYVENGFILLRGLIPTEVAERAADAMWYQMRREHRVGMGGDPLPPRDRPLDREDPSTWADNWDGLVVNSEILGAYTPAFLRAAEELAAANARGALYPVAPHAITKPPQTIALNRFPLPPPPPPAEEGQQGGDFHPEPHCDYGAAGDSGWRSNPQPCRIQTLIYLQASGEPGGANTFVFPGSHRRLAAEYLRDPERYEWMESLAARHPDLSREHEIQPVEVLPEMAGDVLFLDFLCGHAGSPNRSSTPRLAFQTRYGIPLAQPFAVSTAPFTAGRIHTTIW
jgi:hypothetical protein